MGDSACPACGGERTDRVLDVGDWKYASCGACGSGWLDPMPSDPIGYYGAGYFRGAVNDGYLDYGADADLHRRNAVDRIELLEERRSADPERIVDVGCAYGFFLEVASLHGWEAIGVEVSDHARAEAEGRGFRVFSELGDVNDAVGVVTFYQVLEHTLDPLAQLQAAYALLNPGGIVVIESWNSASLVARALGRRWHQVSPPTVTHLFTSQGLETLLERAGFEPGPVVRSSKRVSAGAVAGLLTGKSRVAATVLKPAVRPPISRWVLSYRLGDLVTVAARKS